MDGSNSVFVRIGGTRLNFNIATRLDRTVRMAKEVLESRYGVPVSRQTLRLPLQVGDGSEEEEEEEAPEPLVLEDDRTWASYGIQARQTVWVEVVVAPITDRPVMVNLSTTQWPYCEGAVNCWETDTVGEFRELVVDAVRSTSIPTRGMVLYRRQMDEWGTMADDDHLISEYLVVEGCTVHMAFNF